MDRRMSPDSECRPVFVQAWRRVQKTTKTVQIGSKTSRNGSKRPKMFKNGPKGPKRQKFSKFFAAATEPRALCRNRPNKCFSRPNRFLVVRTGFLVVRTNFGPLIGKDLALILPKCHHHWLSDQGFLTSSEVMTSAFEPKSTVGP